MYTKAWNDLTAEEKDLWVAEYHLVLSGDRLHKPAKDHVVWAVTQILAHLEHDNKVGFVAVEIGRSDDGYFISVITPPSETPEKNQGGQESRPD